MIPYRVRHETLYSYTETVSISHSVARLMPRACDHQELRELQLRIEPTPSAVHGFEDYFGNPAVFFIVDQPHERLRVLTESCVEIEPRADVELSQSPAWEAAAAALRDPEDASTLAAYEFVFDSPFVGTGADFAAYARESFGGGQPLLLCARDLCRRIYREFRYDPEATTLATPVEEVLRERHGVCQDFAHVMIAALRSLGLSARYVSGYIRSSSTGAAPGSASVVAQPDTADAAAPVDLVGSEASHAWVSVFCPHQGWVDFDPTNDLLPSDRHVVLGWGRDYDDVSPLQGVTLGGGLQTVHVGVDVHPIVGAERGGSRRPV